MKINRSYILPALLSLFVMGVFPSISYGWDLKGALEKGIKDAASKVSKSTQNEEESEEESDEKQHSVAKDATAGAVVCGGLAKLFGKDSGTVTKAAIACGAANAAVTVLANQGKKEYSARYQEITKDISSSEKEIAELQKQTASNEKTVAKYQKKVDDLISREKSDKKFLSKAGSIRKEIDKKIRDNKAAKSKAEAKLEILDKQVADLDLIIKDSPDIEALKETKVALINQKYRLTESIKQSNGINENLVAQTSRLDEEIISRS